MTDNTEAPLLPLPDIKVLAKRAKLPKYMYDTEGGCNALSRLVAIATQPSRVQPLVEQLAQQWDGCMWEGPGGDIDIGEALRDAGRRLLGDSVVPTTQPPGATLEPGARSPWISVDERLPEPDTDCVVLWRANEKRLVLQITRWEMMREDPTGMGGPTIETGYGWADFWYEEVPYWMPLPPPPGASAERSSDGEPS